MARTLSFPSPPMARLLACLVLGTITGVLPLTEGLVLVLVLITVVYCVAVAGRGRAPGCCPQP